MPGAKSGGALAQRVGYQTPINALLRKAAVGTGKTKTESKPLTVAALRRVLREELHTSRVSSPGARGRPLRTCRRRAAYVKLRGLPGADLARGASHMELARDRGSTHWRNE